MSKVLIAKEKDGSEWVSLEEYENMKRSAVNYAVIVEQYQKLLGVFTNSSGFAKIIELQKAAQLPMKPTDETGGLS